MRFERNALLASPDCGQLQNLVLAIMKSETEQEALLSNRWSSKIMDFVDKLRRQNISNVSLVSEIHTG